MNRLPYLFSDPMKCAVFAIFLLLATFGICPEVLAGRNDHEKALSAMEAGEIKPLGEILRVLSLKQPGKVLEVELELKSGQWIYEIKMIQDDGVVREIKVNAKSGEILKIKHDD